MIYGWNGDKMEQLRETLNVCNLEEFKAINGLNLRSLAAQTSNREDSSLTKDFVYPGHRQSGSILFDISRVSSPRFFLFRDRKMRKVRGDPVER